CFAPPSAQSEVGRAEVAATPATAPWASRQAANKGAPRVKESRQRGAPAPNEAAGAAALGASLDVCASVPGLGGGGRRAVGGHEEEEGRGERGEEGEAGRSKTSLVAERSAADCASSASALWEPASGLGA
ncbi:unnamed protein product, partial [Prorocentrum cordatum]